MTILSAAMGQILPQLISRNYTEIAAAILFFIFGIKLGWDASRMSGNECLEELEEVTAELVGEDEKKMEEGGDRDDAKDRSKRPGTYMRIPGISPVWIQVFIMTFLAEWGDRSQIASMSFGDFLS